MIEIKHLSKTFQMKDGAVNALKDIDLTIPDGSIYGIIGMSGAGKSTPYKFLLAATARSGCHDYGNTLRVAYRPR